MIDFFDSLPEWAKVRLSESPGYRDWRTCRVCRVSDTRYKLYACSRCMDCRREPVYYCSKKCQRSHWGAHRKYCDSSFAEGNYKLRALENKEIYDDGVGKWISRWTACHSQILYWAIQNIYHYNTHLDPHKSYVTFYLNPRSMQIWTIGVESREAHSKYSETEYDTVAEYQNSFYYVVAVPSTASSVGYSQASSAVSCIKLETPETRKTIQGCPQWPWMAAHLTKSFQPSREVTMAKWNILLAAIQLHTTCGTASFEQFLVSPFKLGGQLILSRDEMSNWYAKLRSIDLWHPLQMQSRPGSKTSYLRDLIDYMEANPLKRDE